MKDTYYKYGAIVTFDNHIISFSLKNPKDITLHKKDEVFIFNKYEIEPEKSVQISGTVVKNPGKYRYFKGETLKDAINNAGIKSPFYETKVQIVSYDKRMQPLLKFVNYKNNPDYKLKPLDEITLFDYYNFNPLKPITVMGAVNKPNIFTYAKDLTLKDALTMAGWFKDKADKNYIELIRYQIINNERVRSIKKLSVKDLDFTLKPYDELYVKTIPNWYKKETVTIKGEVKYPGVYVIQKGERLADVIKRAGGFTRDSYLYGAVFTRESVRKMQQDRINKMIYKLKKKVAIISANAKGAGEQSINAQNLMTAIDSIAIQAQKLKPIGRIVINLNKNLNKFEKSDYNIKLENGDELYIPSKKDSVIVLGEVLTPSAFVYTTDNSLDYIQKAGGETSLGGDKYFVVHANGITEQADLGSWFSSNINVKPGDAITVPIHIQTSTFYGIAKDVASIVYQLAVTAASLKTVGAL
jgi:polysaccharide export outer membrane protein